MDTEVHKVNLIKETYKDDNVMSLCISKLLEKALMTDMQFIENFNLYDT